MRNVIKATLVTIIAFMLQSTFMPYLSINGVCGSLNIALIAIVTVILGRKYTFGVSCLIGILMEMQMSSIRIAYVAAYPILSMLFTIPFVDMSAQKRERRHQMHKSTEDRDPRLRTLLDAICISSSIEALILLYLSLMGTVITLQLIIKSLTAVVYTALITIIIMHPLRGFLRPKEIKASGKGVT